MEKLIYSIGGYVSRNLWFLDTVDEILIESLFIYAMLQVCCAIGLFGIFSKMRDRGWWALVPGVNVTRLGELVGSRFAGFLTALCKIVFLVVAEATVRVYTIPLLNKNVIYRHCGIVVILAGAALLVRMAAGYILYWKLVRRFAESRRWLIPFLLAPNITTLLFGLNPNIRT